MFAIPVQGYHRYVGSSASMRVKAAALVTSPPPTAPSDPGETVTLFNDMCVLAPATLIDPAIQWDALDARATRALFTNAEYTSVPSSRSMMPASCGFRLRGPLSVATRWEDHATAALVDAGGTLSVVRFRAAAIRRPGAMARSRGQYAYIELTIDDVQYNVAPR